MPRDFGGSANEAEDDAYKRNSLSNQTIPHTTRKITINHAWKCVRSIKRFSS